MAFIKSHSNYVLKKKHQDVSDGTIWERDITTIGGVNQFSPGQIPIYKSNNFIITVRNDGKVSNQYNQSKWKENESGETWTLETLSGMTSEFEDQNDVKIILKQDYYDFCDFAYYGSLAEMFRASINDVLKRFPGELYGTDECAYYTTNLTKDFERIENRVVLGDPKDKEIDDCTKIYIVSNGESQLVCRREEEEIKDCKDITDDRYVSNPFGIDAHSIKKPKDGKELKFFAENGYKNYMTIKGDGEGSDEDKITSWKTRNFIKVVINEEMLDNLYGGCAFYYKYLKPEILQDYFNQPDNEVWWMENKNNEIKEKSFYQGTEYEGSKGYDSLVNSFSSGDVRQKYIEYETKWRIEKITTITDTGNCVCEKYEVVTVPNYDTEQEALEAIENLPSEPNVQYIAKIGACCADIDCYFITPCKGYKAASLSATGSTEIVIGAWIGDNDEIVYLSKNMEDIHVRPIEKFIVDFYNECDNFQNIIVNRKTTPLYKAVFSVIKDNENGFYRDLETFIFPTSYGGYNLDANSFGFTEYTTRLADIGAYYDELFTDNLYRSMTHEAIKNFDWTYTREFTYGDETEYVRGGEKIQKALRIFAREFDEILTYINNIRFFNRITYDERSNVPDYFLIDQLESKGWDVCLVYPYDLEEYYVNDSGETIYIDSSAYTEDQQLTNKEGEYFFVRQFSQNTKKEVSPYKMSLLDYPHGYFIVCEDGDTPPCWYSGEKVNCDAEGNSSDTANDDSVTYAYVSAEGSGHTYYYEEKGKLLNRIKSYSDERSYTYIDANNEFLRRMVINSPYIWRHKGTIEGLEMILGMFGLKSKRWVERMPEYRKERFDGKECKDYEYDYEIDEYSSFTKRIEENWDAVHQMYRIDWINSTKSIVYDYRSTSNYTKYGTQPNYISYQGLPVLFRDEYIEYKIDEETGELSIVNKPYIKISPLSANTQQPPTKEADEAFKRIDEKNGPVIRRYLYPNFDKNEQIDGNPYFQMNGGWMSKTVENLSSDTRYNFQYDVDDRIAYTCYEESGRTEEDGSIVDNYPIYKETLRNIRRVDTIGELITIPSESVSSKAICYVSHIEKGVAIVDNEVFNIKYEYNPKLDEKPYRYISLRKNYGYIKIGDDKFFTSTIIVYDKDGNETTYDITDREDGYEIKAYIKYDEDPLFVCKATSDGAYTIDSFMLLDDEMTSASTNYFIIDDPYYSNRLATKEVNNGWRRLNETDQEYIKINTIINYYEGNNPHNGNMRYDSGHEYLTYFKRLFKYPIDEELFDERCYESYYYDLDNEIYDYGFKNLIDNNEMITQYFPYISGLTETKIHYFGSYYKCGYDTSDKCERKKASANTKCEEVMFYGEHLNKMQELEHMYQNTISSAMTVSGYILSDRADEDKNLVAGMIGGTPYSASNMVEIEDEDIDEVTNQIVNNKRLTIKFYLHNSWETNQGQCEIKYLDSIVMNYLSQMIPSTTIFDVQYIGKSNGVSKIYRWSDEEYTKCVGYDLYHYKKQQVSYDNGGTWKDTGKEEVKSIDKNSSECGYVEPTDPVYYHTVSVTECSGTTKITSRITYDGTGAEVSREILSEEENSCDCGYCGEYEIETNVDYIINITDNIMFTVKAKECNIRDGRWWIYEDGVGSRDNPYSAGTAHVFFCTFFKKDSGGTTDYIIEWEDVSGCTAQTVYTVNNITCNCDNMSFNMDEDVRENGIPFDKEGQVFLGRLTPPDCPKVGVYANSDSGWISPINLVKEDGDDEYKVFGLVSKNLYSTSERTANITFTYKGLTKECSISSVVTQNKEFQDEQHTPKTININYNVTFSQIEKGKVTTILKFNNTRQTIVVNETNHTTNSGSQSGIIPIQTTATADEIASSCSWDIENTVVRMVNSNGTYDFTYDNGMNCFTYDMSHESESWEPDNRYKCDCWETGCKKMCIYYNAQSVSVEGDNVIINLSVGGKPRSRSRRSKKNAD